jgi:large subunit ribosomal protein L13
MEKTKVKEKIKKEAKKEEPEKSWYLINAKGKVLGRLATRIALILMGKNKPTWQPYLDKGDNVIVVNAAKVATTGRKEEQKKYFRYSGYPGGLRTEVLSDLRKRKPEYIIHHAVKGMLPKTRLGAAMLKKLYVYPGEEHSHEAQKPEELDI